MLFIIGFILWDYYHWCDEENERRYKKFIDERLELQDLKFATRGGGYGAGGHMHKDEAIAKRLMKAKHVVRPLISKTTYTDEQYLEGGELK